MVFCYKDLYCVQIYQHRIGRPMKNTSAEARTEYQVTLWNSIFIGAGWENRTPDHSLENCYFTIKLIPRILSERRDSNPESPVPKTGMLAVTPRSGSLFALAHTITESHLLSISPGLGAYSRSCRHIGHENEIRRPIPFLIPPRRFRSFGEYASF